MKNPKKQKSKGKKSLPRFPEYLLKGLSPDVSESRNIAKQISSKLRKIRGAKTPADIATALAGLACPPAAKADPQSPEIKEFNKLKEEIIKIERGDFSCKLGLLRHILRVGYGCSLTELLHECYEELVSDEQRPFERTHYYTVVRKAKGELSPTPLFFGGHTGKYLWATPLRSLSSDDATVEFLELAPNKILDGGGGRTPDNPHGGTEIVYVVYGNIDFNIWRGKDFVEGSFRRSLQKGDLVHFTPSRRHYVMNASPARSALLLIVRIHR